jgi:hypothetical protein
VAAAQHRQVLRDRRAADRQPRRKVTDGGRAAAQGIDDLAPGAVAEGFEHHFVSFHEP